eukprot:322431_1
MVLTQVHFSLCIRIWIMAAKSETNVELKIDGEMIAQGAEAKVYKSQYDGRPTVVKYRFAKKYRHPQLDLKLRRNRSKKEQKCIGKAKEAGIQVPELYYYDKHNCAIHMQWIDLPIVKTVLMEYYDANTQMYDDDQAKCTNILKEIGKNIGMLHQSNIIHGDLTTSNLLIDQGTKHGHKELKIVMIDFGLAEGTTKVEDKAVDIYVLERAFVSTHPQSEYMIDIILEAYKQFYPNGHKPILKRLEAVRLRGRKRSMIG